MVGRQFGGCEHPGWVDRPVRFKIATNPVEELRATLLLWHLDAIVQAGNTNPTAGQRVDLGQAVALHHRMSIAPVGKHEDAVGVVKGSRIFWPAIGVDSCHKLFRDRRIEALLEK